MNKTVLLIIGGLLLFIGLVRPNLNLPINSPVDNIIVVSPPNDVDLKSKCKLVIDVLKSGSSDRSNDGKRLSELYMDIATLIELNGDNEIIKTTEEIRQANILSGAMLRMNIKGKYPGLSDAAQTVILSQIGDDSSPLDDALRSKAVEAFRALAWACNEGSK